MKINILIILLFFSCKTIIHANEDTTLVDKNWHLDQLNIPKWNNHSAKKVKVAVIDNGFRITHKAIKDFLYVNSKEIPNNFRDDDNNGYVDDVRGWDFSDNDNDVKINEYYKNTQYHGTYISGIIIKVFSKFFGDLSHDYFELIPIKAASDQTNSKNITNGYEGIRYAADLGADIICCPWSGGKLRFEDRIHLEYALEKGCLIVTNVGNYNSEELFPPGNHQDVLSVAAVNKQMQKTKISSFSNITDIATFGENIYGPHTDADNAYFFENGTSTSTAIVTGLVAILKSISYKSTSIEITEALKSTASPIDEINITYAGKLGAGVPNIENAIKYLTSEDFKFTNPNEQLPTGTINYKNKLSENEILIKPVGFYKGVHLLNRNSGQKGMITIKTLSDSIIFTDKISKLPDHQLILGNGLKLITEKKFKPKFYKFDYYMETIDSSKLFCSGENYLFDDNGKISDGSNENNYANNSVCKWIITAPANKKIKVTFDYIDTEINVDYVWIYDGNSTIPENLLAKFSGDILPPAITSTSNEILIWFLTDNQSSKQGWSLVYEFVE